jgi:hypothetical protein
MPPLSLDLKDAIVVITGIVTIAGVIFTLRGAVAKLDAGQLEMLRQLGALHKRMDHYGQRIVLTEQNHAVLRERVENIRETQRMRRARAEAEIASEPPMFTEGDDG